VVVQHLTGSCYTRSCILLFPLISIALLMVGIVGMVTQPRYVDIYSWFFTLGVPATMFSLFYTFIIVIGSCVEPVALLPIRSLGSAKAGG